MSRKKVAIERLEARRLLSAGELDTAFGVGGYVTTDLGAAGVSAHDVVVQADGKIVVAGTAGGDFAVTRYNADGTLDASFGDGGRVTTDFGGADEGHGVTLGPGGRIVVAGASDGDLAVAVYLPNGTLDGGFSGDGKATVDFGRSYESAEDVAVQADGRIVLAGFTADWFGESALVRFTPDGALDPTFGEGGKVLSHYGGFAESVAIDASNRIVTAGRGGPVMSPEAVVARYEPDGSLDSTFGDGGVDEVVGSTSFVGFNDVAIQPDGRIVAVGFVSSHFLAVRLNADGTRDMTFNPGGSVDPTTGFEYFSLAGVALQRDGKVVAVGGVYDGAHTVGDAAVVRMNADGSFDPSFAGDGLATTDLGADDYARAVAVQPDGRIVVVSDHGGTSFLVARYRGDAAIPTGGAGTDGLAGGDGVDTLRGGVGGDILIGGADRLERRMRWRGGWRRWAFALGEERPFGHAAKAHAGGEKFSARRYGGYGIHRKPEKDQ